MNISMKKRIDEDTNQISDLNEYQNTRFHWISKRYDIVNVHISFGSMANVKIKRIFEAIYLAYRKKYVDISTIATDY